MYITKEQLDLRLNQTEIQINERTRKSRSDKGHDRLTHEDRVLAGVLEGEDTQKNIAELLGVSSQTVSNNSRGLVSPTIGVDTELKNDIAEIKGKNKDKIKEQLLDNLASALGHVGANLHNTDAIEASKIAVDMSKILDRVDGESGGGKGNRTAIIINVPSRKEEKDYASITI